MTISSTSYKRLEQVKMAAGMSTSSLIVQLVRPVIIHDSYVNVDDVDHVPFMRIVLGMGEPIVTQIDVESDE